MKKGKNKHYAKKHHGFLSLIFRIILIVFSISLFISYISIFVNPAHFWLPGFFGLYFIPIFTINFILLIIAIVRRSKSVWIPIVSLLPSLLFCEYYFKIGNEEVQSDGTPYRIVTYNTGQFASSRQGFSREACRDSVIKFIEEQRPDIACFQEFSVPDTSLIYEMFTGYPYRHYHFFKIRDNYFFGNLTISKYPIVSKGIISFKGSTNLSIYSDIQSNNFKIRVYNNHLESYNISPTSFMKKLADGYEEVSKEFAEVHGKVKISNYKRALQVDMVMKHIDKCDHPSIICGDFNDTPMSYTYHKLSKLSNDTFLEAGHGFSATYSVLWPLLRIDFILVPESFHVKSHTTTRIKLSDHYPVSTIIYKNNEYGDKRSN